MYVGLFCGVDTGKTLPYIRRHGFGGGKQLFKKRI
jgi:hypothetical protein